MAYDTPLKRQQWFETSPRGRGSEWAYDLWRMYKITPEQYAAMLEAQGGGCAICGVKPDENGRRFPVDHDHNCCNGKKSCGKCVRGVLCTSCNRGLGSLEKHLVAALTYLSAPNPVEIEQGAVPAWAS